MHPEDADSSSLIVNLIAHGKQPGEIIQEYPDLEPEDIQQSLEYEGARDRSKF